MNTFLMLAFLFFVGSMLGWVIELFFRRIKNGYWINPGFLKGPYLPIYGLGLVFMYLISLVDMSWITPAWVQHVVRIFSMGILMTLIEFIGGLVFIKGMKIKLWDYSKRWGNVKGVICPLFSAIWTAVGALYYYLLHPIFYSSVAWFVENIWFSFVVGMFFGAFFIDLATTLKLSVKIRKFAKEHDIVVRYEKLKEDIKNDIKAKEEKYGFSRFVNPIVGNLKDFVAAQKEEIKSKYEEIKSGK